MPLPFIRPRRVRIRGPPGDPPHSCRNSYQFSFEQEFSHDRTFCSSHAFTQPAQRSQLAR